ncbi:MAG: hypothetical protein IKC51_03275, partial [Myxococcaceae bacterium]|nr:hypothetical protein [Myxococcaceae bacterium]
PPSSTSAPSKYTLAKLKSSNHLGEPVWGRKRVFEQIKSSLCGSNSKKLPSAEASLICPALKRVFELPCAKHKKTKECAEAQK